MRLAVGSRVEGEVTIFAVPQLTARIRQLRNETLRAHTHTHKIRRKIKFSERISFCFPKLVFDFFVSCVFYFALFIFASVHTECQVSSNE